MRVISWQRAISLFFLGKVEVVEEYDREIRSVSVAIKMPAVVRLFRYVKLGKRRPPLNRTNILARDRFACQYCGSHLGAREATLDHVLPRSQGGTTCWENVVTACANCNRKKGGRTPKQANMRLLSHPIQPDWLPVLSVKFSARLPEAWLVFLEE